MNSQVSFGPLTRRVVEGAEWTDQYPDTQAWADECEQLLAFAQSHDVFGDYLSRLQGDKRQRDAALAEIRVARFLAVNGYRPQTDTWKPNGGPDSDGEFIIKGPNGDPVLVEVKHRTWQGELTEKEIQEGRAKKRKYIDGEGRWPEPWKAIQRAIEKAYGKFKDQAPNLLIVPDDLFWRLPDSPNDLNVGLALYSKLPLIGVNPSRVLSGYFTDSRYENSGGVGIFQVIGNGYTPVQYGMELYINAFALPSTRLPRDFVRAFKGVRLWDDPPQPNSKPKRLGDNDHLDRDKILNILKAKRDDLRHYGVESLSFFGSAARGENDPASDLDFLVELHPKTFANYMGLKEYLENLFGCRVDLVLGDAIKPALRNSILSECIHAPGL